jgi:hypothetical protein
MIECCQYGKNLRVIKKGKNFLIGKRLRASEETSPSMELVITAVSFSD